jgi:hypothetical protein
MNTFRYDSTSIEYFDSQDLGSIGDAPTSTVDRGTNFFDFIVEEGTAGVMHDDFIVETGTDFIVDDVTATENYNLIVWTETTYPFGNINVSGGEGNSAGVVFVAVAEPIVLREKAIVITKQAWTGSGTLFEIANGLERKVAPYIGGSGPLRISGAVQDSATFDFTEESLKAYGSDTDNGQVTAAVGSSVDYGTVTSLATPNGEIDFGDITKNEGIPFGSLKVRGLKVTSNRFSSYKGSGSFSVLSGGIDQLDEPPGAQTYVVGRDLATGQFIRNDVIGLRFYGGNPEAFARVGYQGSGRLFGLSGGLERKVYDYNSGSIVTFSVGTDAGDVTSAATTTEDYGQVTAQSSGDTDHGSLVITETRQPLTGLFKLTGGDIAHSNPRAFAGSGAIKTYKGKAVVNAGQASDFAFLPHWRSRGGITITNHVIPDAFARTHVGSGSLFEIGQKDERAVFSYNVDPIVTGSIAPVTVLANDTQYINTSSFDDVRVAASGAGTTSTNGFNVGTHLAFGYVNPEDTTTDNRSRSFDLQPLNSTELSSITFSVIRGNGSNGGETADSGEDLSLWYKNEGDSSFQLAVGGFVTSQSSGFTVLKDVTVNIPAEARTTNTIFRVKQIAASGYQFDHYGITQFVLNDVSTLVSTSGQIYETVGTSDAGTVDQSAGTNENYGTITEPFTNGILDYGELRPGFFKFGNINITGRAVTPVPRSYHGSGVFNPTGGRATVQFAEPAVQVYHYGFGERQTSIGEFLKLGGGMSQLKVVKGSWIGSGSLNNSGKNDERAVFDYTEESIAVVQDPIDNGLVTASATANANYGAVTQPSTGDTSYGSITNLITNNPFGKLFEWTGGDIAHSNPRAYLGATAEISISGGYSNLKFVSQAGESTALFDITNGPSGENNTYARVRPFIASGSLFSHGVKTEKATVAYNESSIAESFTFTDAGSVGSTATTSVDYGQISTPAPASNITDNGSVLTVTGDERPLGKLFEIQGSAIENFFPKFIWNRQSPAIRIFNEQQDPADFRFTPHWRTRHLLGTPTIRNAPDGEFNTYARVRPFIASGSLFSHGVKVEKATVDYNSASIVEFTPGGDYGSITNSAGTTVDYGTVTSLATPDGEVDLGQIVITETRQPLTGLFKFAGAAPKVQFIRGPYVAKGGLLNVSGSLVERVAQADDIGGTVFVNGIGETPRARDFVGKGRLFGIGDKVESATFDYNGGSVVDLTPSEDYGSITNNATTTDDLGSVTSTTPGGEVDYGQIIITQTRQPLTGLLQLQGASENQFIRGPYVARPHGFRIFNEQQDPADFRFSPHWRARPYEQGKLSGEAATPRARDFVGSGSLFHIGDKIEKAVFRYTTESVVEFEVGSDYGSITNNPTTTSDLGNVTSTTPGGEIDNGSVVITQTRQPLTGLFRITGHDTGHKQTFSEVSQTVEISLSGTAVEKFTSGAGETTALFSFTGSLAESFGKGNYAGSGSLFHIGDRVEKAVFSYNTSSVVEGFGTEQYGLITDNATTTDDLGSVDNAYLPPTIDHGDLVILPGEENPFGLFRIAGGDIGHKQTFTEFSSGSLFGASGAAEAAVWQTPEETFLFRTSGGAIEKHVENYVGTGNIKIKEETPLAPNAAVRFRPHWRGQHLLGTPRILGNADSALKGSYVSEGVFSRMYTHDKGEEWLRYRPSPRYVNSIYGKIGGSAFVNGDGGTRKINVYGYYGDDRDPGTSGSLFGIGGGAEASSVTPPAETVLFRVNGTAPSKFNPHWRGRPDGSPRLSGTPDLVLRFNIFTNPEVAKFTFNGDAVPVRTIIHKGSGKLFSAGSAAEVVGFNPETETRAFKFSGEPIVRIRVILFQFGTLFGFGGASESRTIEVPQSTVLFVPSGTAGTDRARAFEGTGSETLSGQSVEKRTAAHVGSGSLFSADGAAESRTASIPESTVLFSAAGGDQNAFARPVIGTGSATINGDSTDSRSRIHVGSGSLFSIGGASESATVAEESTGLFEFNGSAEPVIRTRGFAGSGSLFAIGGGVEIAAVAPESTGLFTVSGEAQAPFARTKIGAGATFVSGDSENKATRVYTGEGQLSTFGGGAEVVGFNPAEETLLYTTQGNATVITTNAFAGSGTENVSGEAVPVITLSFVGSGNLTTFGGGAESRTIDVENTTLFETRGGATESFGRGAYHGDVETTISGEATDIKLTFGNQVFGYIGRTDGQAVEKQTDDYVGSGSLFGLSSGTTVRSRDYDETGIGQQGEVVSTNLFRISGNNPGSVTRITQPGTVRISMQGEAVPVLKLFSPIRIYSTII